MDTTSAVRASDGRALGVAEGGRVAATDREEAAGAAEEATGSTLMLGLTLTGGDGEGLAPVLSDAEGVPVGVRVLEGVVEDVGVHEKLTVGLAEGVIEELAPVLSEGVTAAVAVFVDVAVCEVVGVKDGVGEAEHTE